MVCKVLTSFLQFSYSCWSFLLASTGDTFSCCYVLVIQLRPNCTSFWISFPLFQGSFFKLLIFLQLEDLFSSLTSNLYGFLYSLVQGSSIPRLTWSTNMPERGLYLLSSSFKAICNTPHPSFFRRRYRAPMNKVSFSVIFHITSS